MLLNNFNQILRISQLHLKCLQNLRKIKLNNRIKNLKKINKWINYHNLEKCLKLFLKAMLTTNSQEILINLFILLISLMDDLAYFQKSNLKHLKRKNLLIKTFKIV